MSTTLSWPDKFEQETFPNGVQWSSVLDGDTIDSCDAAVASGAVTLTSPEATSFTGTLQTVWVSGGTVGQVEVLCSITTTNGKTYAQKVSFAVRADA